jgi:tetratricopeptide (TPR) repeat protein
VTLTLIGIIYQFQGHFEEAVTILRQGLEFSLQTRFPPVIVYTLHALGSSLADLPDIDAAQETFLRALHFAEQFHIEENEAGLRGELGVLAYRQNDLRLAQDYLESALDQLRALHSEYYLPIFLGHLVVVYTLAGADARAETALREGAELVAHLPDELANHMMLWGAVHLWMSRATRENLLADAQLELTRMAALWAGLVLASLRMTPYNRARIQQFVPQMQTILGVEPVAELLATGEHIDMGTAVDQLRRALS